MLKKTFIVMATLMSCVNAMEEREQSSSTTEFSKLVELIDCLNGESVSQNVLNFLMRDVWDDYYNSDAVQQWRKEIEEKTDLGQKLTFPRGPFSRNPISLYGSTNEWCALTPFEQANVIFDVMIQWALQHGADINTVDLEQKIRRYQKSQSEKEKIHLSRIIHILAAHGARVTSRSPSVLSTMTEIYPSPILRGLLLGDPESDIIKAIDEARPTLHMDKLGEILVLGTAQGCSKVVAALVQHGSPDERWPKYYAQEAFVRAAQRGDPDMLKALSSLIEKQSKACVLHTLCKSLLAAATLGRTEAVRFLLNHFNEAWVTQEGVVHPILQEAIKRANRKNRGMVSNLLVTFISEVRLLECEHGARFGGHEVVTDNLYAQAHKPRGDTSDFKRFDVQK